MNKKLSAVLLLVLGVAVFGSALVYSPSPKRQKSGDVTPKKRSADRESIERVLTENARWIRYGCGDDVKCYSKALWKIDAGDCPSDFQVAWLAYIYEVESLAKADPLLSAIKFVIQVRTLSPAAAKTLSEPDERIEKVRAAHLKVMQTAVMHGAKINIGNAAE